MGALKTCCGFYCAMTSLVGIYFFIIIAIMEYRGNSYLLQIIQNVVETDDKGVTTKHEIDHNNKGTAFLITAAIQAVFTVACYWCGSSSLREDQAIIDAEVAEQTK